MTLEAEKKFRGSDEPVSFWLVFFGIFIQFLFIHSVLDDTWTGPAGLSAAVFLSVLVALVSKKLDLSPVIYIHSSLIIMSTIVAWYMLAGEGIRSPAAMCATAIPGIALFFLGKRHFIFWAAAIVGLYTLMLLYPPVKYDIGIPLPYMEDGKRSAEYWGVSIIMLNAFSFIFYFLVRARSMLEEQARTDPLTKALNREGIGEEIVRQYAVFQRYKTPFSIVILDADDFKKINDTHGHAAGDEVLLKIVGAMKKYLRQTDLMARWGGEEFLALLPNTGLESARQVAERICAHIESLEMELNPDLKIRFTCSLGVSAVQTEDESCEETIRNADAALYRAKNTGRNRVCVAGKDERE